MSTIDSASLPRLNGALVRSLRNSSTSVTLPAASFGPLPERVLQFGEGNFLRAFVDWMLHRMNEQRLFGGRAVLVQPIAQGMTSALNAQDGLYTVILRGLSGGRVVESREVVASASRGLNPYEDFDAFLACARNPDLRFVVSNTTEAGIRTDPADRLDARPAVSFPGKLTQVLYERFRHFAGDRARGLVVLPCELIERNGDALARAVRDTARNWKLAPEFDRWLLEACVFANTLVDRIVTGYPKDEADGLSAELGYDDRLMVAGEVFHAWVIESGRPLDDELPFRKAGLDVIFTNDMNPYRERKVRILNGAHTMTVLAAYLDGKDTVRQCMEDDLIRDYMQRGIADEILPTLTLPRDDLTAFANAVVERFRNPFIKHYLLSISLNSVSKYKARILGTVLDYARREGRLPPRLTFALAALTAFYRGTEIRDGALVGRRQGVEYLVKDDLSVLEFFREAWSAAGPGLSASDGQAKGAESAEFCLDLCQKLLGRVDFWGQDLNRAQPGFAPAVADHLHAICNLGVRAALQRLERQA